MSLQTDNRPEDIHLSTEEDSGGTKTKQAEGQEAVGSAMLEPSTLQWPGDRQPGKGDRMSVKSDTSLREASSRTESERELKAVGVRRGGGEDEDEVRRLMEEEAAGRKHLEEEEEEPQENRLPEKAAQVFSPAVTVLPSPSSPRDTEAFWEMVPESPRRLLHDYNHHGYQSEWPEETPPAKCGQCGPSRDVLKVGVSVTTSALFFPFLVWGGYVFLPFDAPLLDRPADRLVYTLRCSVFAAAPIILGWLVLGVSRLRSGAFRPLLDDDVKEVELHDVAVHRRFISDSASLFLIYFLQLVVMAMYLSQDQLKLIPLLTIVFAFGRLVYWVAAAFGSSVRGFGFGLSFLPSLAMMVANLYFIFTVESSGSIFSLPPPPEEALTPPAGKQRFWG